MSKKKGGKRVTKRQMVELLQTFFQEHPNEIYSFKQIFRALKLDTSRQDACYRHNGRDDMGRLSYQDL